MPSLSDISEFVSKVGFPIVVALVLLFAVGFIAWMAYKFLWAAVPYLKGQFDRLVDSSEQTAASNKLLAETGGRTVKILTDLEADAREFPIGQPNALMLCNHFASAILAAAPPDQKASVQIHVDAIKDLVRNGSR